MRIHLLTQLFVLLSWTAVAQQNTTEILSAYLSVKTALVKDDYTTAKKSAERLSLAIDKSGAFKQKSELTKYTDLIKNATTIEGQRKEFAKLSVTLWSHIKAQKPTETTLYYQYCPMKKAYWISNKSEIENPYYGKSMLNCGKIAEKK